MVDQFTIIHFVLFNLKIKIPLLIWAVVIFF